MLTIQNFYLYSEKSILLTIPDITFETADFVYIRGTNSTGKSLLLNTMAGKYQDFKGHIYLKKIPLAEHLKQNNILLLNHQLPVQKDKTMLQNIEIPFGKLTLKQKQRLIEMATTLNIIEKINHKMVYTSTSEKFAMYLVRAALISPTMILIDDIDTYFDAENIQNAIKLFQYCQKSGILTIATGKAHIENIHSYFIDKGEVHRL